MNFKRDQKKHTRGIGSQRDNRKQLVIKKKESKKETTFLQCRLLKTG